MSGLQLNYSEKGFRRLMELIAVYQCALYDDEVVETFKVCHDLLSRPCVSVLVIDEDNMKTNANGIHVCKIGCAKRVSAHCMECKGIKWHCQALEPERDGLILESPRGSQNRNIRTGCHAPELNLLWCSSLFSKANKDTEKATSCQGEKINSLWLFCKILRFRVIGEAFGQRLSLHIQVSCSYFYDVPISRLLKQSFVQAIISKAKKLPKLQPEFKADVEAFEVKLSEVAAARKAEHATEEVSAISRYCR